MKNYVASVQGHLRQLAVETGKKHQLLLTRYFQERLIYRVSVSNYSEQFCLKGGALLYALEGNKSRPTMDIDLLGLHIRNTQEQLYAIFQEICQITCEQDGVYFLIDTLRTSEIGKDRRYTGVRVEFEGRLGNIRQSMQVDIGFGDVITPSPVNMEYPTLLPMPAPLIKAYSTETILSEKFEAMVDLADSNSRMKDFYDIHCLLLAQKYNPDTLKNAVFNTFHRRGTQCINNHPIFETDFGLNPQRVMRWKSYLKKSNLDTSIELVTVINGIKEVFFPIYIILSK